MVEKTWKEKLNAPRHLPKVIRLTGMMKARWGVGTMVIPSPSEVDALMKRVPKGNRCFVADYQSALITPKA